MVSVWNQNQDLSFYCTQETHLNRDRHYLREKGWKTTFQANEPKKQVSVAILISDKIIFKPNLIRRYKGHYMLITEKLHQEYCSSKHPCTKHKDNQVHKNNTTVTKTII